MFSKPPGAAILLAAGSSSRLGQPKQLVCYEGQSLLRRSASLALASGADPVIVVLGNRAESLRPELAGLPLMIVENADWASGMSSSLRCGLRHLQHHAPEASAVMMMVCDQPLLRASQLQALWQRQRMTGQVVAAEYQGRAGVPAIFPASYLSRFAGLSGDQGARSLLRRLSPAELQTISIPEAAMDVDTLADLDALPTNAPKAGS